LWAAIWLYKATKEQTFLDLAESQYDSFGGGETPKEFSWDNKYAGVQVKVFTLPHPSNPTFRNLE